MIISIFTIVVITGTPQLQFITENGTEWQISNSRMEIRVSKENGNINAIVLEGQNLLSGPGTISIAGSSIRNSRITNITVEDNSPQYAEIYFEKFIDQGLVKYRLMMDSLSFNWGISAVSTSDRCKEVSIIYSLPFIQAMSHVFSPSKDSSISLNSFRQKEIAYHKNVVIPFVSFYHEKRDYGLSIIAPFDIPKPDLIFSIGDDNLCISFNHLRFSNKHETNAALYIVPHEGDWRPGLEFLLDKYPEYFYPAVENTKIAEGWYSQARPYDTREKIQTISQKNVKWIEFLYYFPFFGLYAPRVQNWGLIYNSDAVSLSDWENGAGVDRNSYERVNDLIGLWHKHGIQIYLYFQAFEAWHQYAEKYFADDIAEDAKGYPLPSWKFTNLMNPGPLSKWGQYIIGQANDLIAKYPMIDGIFYDRMDYWNYDFAHDDVITMVDNKPAYMLGFAQEKINQTIFDIFHRNNKGIWGNGPTSIEVCKNLDGLMVEGNVRNLYTIQYLGLVRPIVYLPYDKTPGDTENKLKKSLLCGAFPSITYGDEECQRLDAKYNPLFDIIYNRMWVLTKKPIEIPKEFNGNIFKTPEGNYAIIITNFEKSQLIPHPFEYDSPVVVNIPDADAIEYAYLLSGDWSGPNIIDLEKTNKMLKINVPYLLSTSLIYLTKERKFDVARSSSPVLIKGENEDMVFHVDNLGVEGTRTFTIETPWFKETKKTKSNIVEFHTKIPKELQGEVNFTINYNNKKHTMSCWIVDPISISPKEDIFVRFPEGEDIPFYITNNSNKKHSIDIRGEFTEGRGTIKVPKKLLFQPLASKVVKLPIISKTAGIIQLTIVSDNKEVFRKLFPVKAALSFDKDDLFHDDFKDDMKKWTVQEGRWDVSKGIAQASGSSHFAFTANKNWQDYIVEVRIRCRGSDDPAVDWQKAYVFFRLKDENNFYRFGIHGGYDMISLYKRVAGKWFELAKTPFTAQIGRWYVLKADVRGDKITGYLDGKIVIETTDTTHPSGGIGIGVLEDRMITDYKDVIVRGQ